MLRRDNALLHALLVLALAGVAGWVVFSAAPPNGPIPALRLGLDLQGGTQLIYEADLSVVPSEDREQALQGVRDVIERRVNAFGVAEPRVATSGGVVQGRIVVELPGMDDPDEAERQIGETPLLEFYEMADISEMEGDIGAVLEEGMADQWVRTGLSGRHLRSANVDFDPTTGAPVIRLQFDREGRELFAEITRRNVGRPVGIFLDGEPVTVPVVQQAILTGESIITGQFSIAEARETATQLNAGALPVPITLLSRTTVGPTLGQVSFVQGITAAVVGLSALVLYMITLYRLPGLVAAVALLLYGILALAAFRIIGVTMTLAGIAGFVLSLGIAVDANVLVFERFREQLRRGKQMIVAGEEGFRAAWPAIRDGNVSTLIVCVLLYILGTSVVQGFALTLGVGILLSMFTAIIATRTFLRIAVSWVRAKRWYVPEGAE